MKGQKCTVIRHDKAGNGRLSPSEKIFKEQISLEISRNRIEERHPLKQGLKQMEIAARAAALDD